MPYIHDDSYKISYKRKVSSKSEEKDTHNTESKRSHKITQPTNAEVHECIDNALRQMETLRRADDFICILRAIKLGALLDHIALLLILDVSRFLLKPNVY